MYSNELKLFQRGRDLIWTDEHISKSLLDAHIDESNDAASRRYENRIDIVNWINKYTKQNSKIIDFGCGPGLYAYELGKLGHTVFGIDFNKASINYANENKVINGLVEYRYGNYIENLIDGKYNAAMIVYFDFSVLFPDEQKIFLQNLNNLLEDDGIFIFDIYGKTVMEDKHDRRDWYISQGNDFWSKDPYLLIEETKVFENENRWAERYYLIDQKTGKVKEFINWNQCFDEITINELLLKNGFEVIEINKDLGINSEETLFIIAKKMI
ncbi:MAG: class I SAM-dependent methyltransferase [Oscillospiraceae bacterium]|nr:class I SAM-dependent methyltransferase [Oscillospiraceae bacterium]